MVDKLARALVFLSGRTDLIVAILMLVAIIMIIIPLPTWLVDGLIAVNIMLSMLVLLLIAARLAPDDEGVLRTLAEAFLRSQSPQAAEEVLDRLQSLSGADPMLDLLRSRAQWLAGNEREAKRTFRKFLENRERT